MSEILLGLADAVSEDVADVESVVLLLLSLRQTLALGVCHLLLLEQELLLLLLHHPFLQNLLELRIHLLWQWLDWVAVFIDHLLAFFCQHLLVLSILEQLDDLLRRKVGCNTADLVSRCINVTSFVVIMAIVHLVLELGVALTLFLFRRGLVDHSLGLIAVSIVLQVVVIFTVILVAQILLLLSLQLLHLLLQQHVSL